MVLLSLHGLPAAQIAVLLDCPRHGAVLDQSVQPRRAGRLADRPRRGRPRLGGQRLTGRIAALLARASVIAVIRDNDSIHYARKVTAHLFPKPTTGLLPGLLTATRTELPPADDTELTNTKKHHGIT
jgi:hypothetical protein